MACGLVEPIKRWQNASGVVVCSSTRVQVARALRRRGQGGVSVAEEGAKVWQHYLQHRWAKGCGR
eukprot:8966048-Lingulodinium_polyedra.AAC.1